MKVKITAEHSMHKGQVAEVISKYGHCTKAICKGTPIDLYPSEFEVIAEEETDLEEVTEKKVAKAKAKSKAIEE